MRISSKDEILLMYDRVMMNYQNYLLICAQNNEGRINESFRKHYVGKIEVLRIILGFNGNMEEDQHEEA